MVKKILFVVVLGLMSFGTAHKFYVSVTNVNYSEKNVALEITTRVFVDDLEAVMKERYGVSSNFESVEDQKSYDLYLKRYLNSKFVVELNGNPITYAYLGKELENDLVIFYLEVDNVEMNQLKSLTIFNEVLTDMYDEQKNIVHIKWHNNKKSFVLTKYDAKGMLNF